MRIFHMPGKCRGRPALQNRTPLVQTFYHYVAGLAAGSDFAREAGIFRGCICGRKPCTLCGRGAFYANANLLDRAGGAGAFASAAVNTDVSIDRELVAVSLDRIHGAGFLAGTAADTDFFVNLVSHNMYLHTSIEICRPFCISTNLIRIHCITDYVKIKQFFVEIADIFLSKQPVRTNLRAMSCQRADFVIQSLHVIEKTRA